MNVMRFLRLLSRCNRKYRFGPLRVPTRLSFHCFSGIHRLELADVRALSTHSLRACQRPPYRSFSDNEADEAGGVLDEADELENVRVHLYPDSDDPVLRGLGRTTSVDDVFIVLGDSVDPRHLCQTVVSLWDVHKLNEEPGPLPADDYSRLMEALLRRADSCDDLALVCALYCVVRLEGPGWQEMQTQLEDRCTARLPHLSLAALSRFGVCLQLHETSQPWPPRLVRPYMRALAGYTASCDSWHELRLLASAVLSAHCYLSLDSERRFMELVHRFIVERDVGPDDVDSVFKLFKVLNTRGLRHWLAPVCRDLASLYVRTEPRPPAAVTAQLGQAMLRFREASPAVERLLAERAVALLAQDAPQTPLQLRLLDTAAPHRMFPAWLRDGLLEATLSSLQSLEDQLNSPAPMPDKASRIRFFTELQRARQLLGELRPQRPAEHRRLWHLCLRTLRRPDVWIVSEESVARRHALTYFGHMAQLSPACGLPELEAELRERLERHSRQVFGTNRLVELLSYLMAYGGRPLPADQLSRLLWLADRDQLSTHRVNRLSRAIQIGRARIQRMHTPQSTEHLHQLTQATIALNNTTVRLLPSLTSIEAVVWLAGAALRRRGVVPGNTSVLEAALARFRQLADSPELCRDQLTSRAVDKLASCLEAARYADDTVMEHLCRHVVQHRDRVTGVLAERVLSAAFRTGYWPSDSGLFDDFLAAAANIISRSLYRLTAESTLRACQSLCLYGQLPVQLARTVLGQAFLDKTERQIQHLVEQTDAQSEVAGVRSGPVGVRRGSVQTAATRLRRLQMEVNRAVRLNMPDQSVPWFTDVYAKGLPDPVTGLAHRQLMTEVRETLAALVGGEDRVHSGVRTAGYQFTADMVVYRRPDGGYTDTDGPRVTSVAVLVPSTHDYCINRAQVTGSQLLRRRHLEMLGFTVRTVHPHHWNSMALAEPADKLRFLAALLEGRNLLEERA